ncbi:MAG: hypothetical protein GVY22_16110 [Gammaproteobacteria bacterium]|nr:hypothetical protein [Gammaproteobacteria bacterium]
MSHYKSLALALPLALSVAGSAVASPRPIGIFATDSFGWSGTVYEYGSLADAQSGTNWISENQLGSEPVDLFINNGAMGFGPNYQYANLIGGPSNYVFLNDLDSSTDTSINFTYIETSAGIFDVTVDLEGSDPNGLDYMLDVTALGVAGTLSSGWLFSDSNPTGVSGSFNGIIDDGTEFYSFELAFDMNGNSEFGSNFAAVPTPATLLLFGAGLLGLAGARTLNGRRSNS